MNFENVTPMKIARAIGWLFAFIVILSSLMAALWMSALGMLSSWMPLIMVFMLAGVLFAGIPTDRNREQEGKSK